MQGGDEVVMALAVLVIDSDPSLQKRSEARGVKRSLQPDVKQGLGLVQKEAAVTIRAGHQRFACIGGQRQRPPKEFLRALDQLAQGVSVEPVQDQNLAARQKRRV